MVSVQAVIFRLTNEENHMIEKLHIYMTTNQPPDDDDDDDDGSSGSDASGGSGGRNHDTGT